MRMRESRSTPVAFAAAVLVLAQIVGCGSCVKDDPQSTSTSTGLHNGKQRKPIPLQAADKRNHQPFPHGDGGSSVVDAATD